MKSRYILSSEAAEDLLEIWHYIEEQSTREMADNVESAIRDQIIFLARNPGAGHTRKDITSFQSDSFLSTLT